MSEVGVDLYEILGLKFTASDKDIQKAFFKLTKKYHPDKSKNENREEAEEMYELITHSYNVLSDKKLRVQYDHAYKLSKESKRSHVKLSSEFDQFIKAQENWKDDDEKNKLKDENEKKFLLEMSALDAKHGYDPEEVDPFTIKEGDQRLEDLIAERKQQEIEDTMDPIFDPKKKFNPAQFNAMWKKAYGSKPMGLVKTNKPTAFNSKVDNEFTNIDEDSGLYDEGNPDDLDNDINGFANVNFGNKIDFNPDEFDNMSDDEDFDLHNTVTKNDLKTYEQKIKEYNNETDKYSADNMNFDDFKNEFQINLVLIQVM